MTPSPCDCRSEDPILGGGRTPCARCDVDTDRPVYVAVRYVYHDKDTAPYEPPPGTMTPKEIIDRALHPSVARTTIWCPGVDPEPGPTDLDEETVEDHFYDILRERKGITEEAVAEISAFSRFNRARSNVIPLTPGQQQAHYGHSMAEGMPDGDDVA